MKTKIILILNFIICAINIQSCTQLNEENKGDNRGPEDFPEIVNANIPGAPKLGKPILIMGDSLPVVAKGVGYASPAVFDMDKDGKKDLLIGEFGSGSENGLFVGHLIRVYKNVGDSVNPKFTDKFSYAWHSRDALTNGTPISIKQT